MASTDVQSECLDTPYAIQVVGEGYHPEAGKPHAEVYALRAAGQAAKGATAYVTLEPCNHYGRTPPCSRALVAAEVSRVCHSRQLPSCAEADPVRPRYGGPITAFCKSTHAYTVLAQGM